MEQVKGAPCFPPEAGLDGKAQKSVAALPRGYTLTSTVDEMAGLMVDKLTHSKYGGERHRPPESAPPSMNVYTGAFSVTAAHSKSVRRARKKAELRL